MSRTSREILEEAELAFDTYKRADLSEAQSLLDTILGAAGLGGVSNDEITHLSVGGVGRMVRVSTRYSVRCCEQNASYEFPSSILDAKDPAHAARRWGLVERLRAAESEVASARRSLQHRENDLLRIQRELSVLDGGSPE